MRVLVTGSRIWTDKYLIEMELKKLLAVHGSDLVVVHGAAKRGADRIVDDIAARLRIHVERHPADWQKHGKPAGYLRNFQMVKRGADLCLAFITNQSKGATHCATLAEEAGIRTVRFTESVSVVAEGDVLFAEPG